MRKTFIAVPTPESIESITTRLKTGLKRIAWRSEYENNFGEMDSQESEHRSEDLDLYLTELSQWVKPEYIFMIQTQDNSYARLVIREIRLD